MLELLSILVIGTVIFVTSVVLLSDPNIKKAISKTADKVGNKIKPFFDELINAIAYASDKAIRRLQNTKTANHHIVAKRASKAAIARYCLHKVDIGIEAVINKVNIKQNLHYHLHTTTYYVAINTLVMQAYGSKENTSNILRGIKKIIEEANKLLP